MKRVDLDRKEERRVAREFESKGRFELSNFQTFESSQRKKKEVKDRLLHPSEKEKRKKETYYRGAQPPPPSLLNATLPEPRPHPLLSLTSPLLPTLSSPQLPPILRPTPPLNLRRPSILLLLPRRNHRLPVRSDSVSWGLVGREVAVLQEEGHFL